MIGSRMTSAAGGTAAIVAIMMLLSGCSAGGGDPSSRGPACDGCQLQLTHRLTLGADSDPASADTRSSFSIARDGQGAWYVVAIGGSYPVMKYHADGTYSGPLGRHGDGPGEYRGALRVVASHDSVHVFSSPLRRTSYSVDGAYLGSEVLRIAPWEPLPAHAGGWVFLGGRRGESAPNRLPLHFLGADGSIRSAGPARPDYRWMHAAVQAADSVWLVPRLYSYRIELWSPDGGPHRAIERRPDWFPWPPDGYVHARVTDLWYDSGRELLWVAAAHLADEATDQRISIVEMLDPATGQLVAADTIPGDNTRFTHDGIVYSAATSASGNAVIHIWQPEFIPPAGPGSEG